MKPLFQLGIGSLRATVHAPPVLPIIGEAAPATPRHDVANGTVKARDLCHKEVGWYFWENGPVSESPEIAPVKPVIAAGAAKRANASVIGMMLAIFSTLAIVLTIVWLNPSPKSDGYRPTVDVAAISANASDVAGFTPVVPVLPEKWYANYGRWSGAGVDGVAFWDVGFVTSADSFIALKQSANANPSWVATQAQNAPVTGTRTIAGQEWQLRDKPKGDRSLVLEKDGTTVVLTGAADFKEFDTLAAAVTAAMASNPAPTATKGSK